MRRLSLLLAVAVGLSNLCATTSQAANLPAGYKPVEWLYLTDKSWTLSGYTPSATDRIEMTIKMQSNQYGAFPLFCASGTTAGTDVIQCRFQQGKLYFRRNNGSEVNLSVTMRWYKSYTVIYDGATLKGGYDDGSCALTEGEFTSGSELAFFATHKAGAGLKASSSVTTGNGPSNGAFYFYGVRIFTADGTLVREYVPAEDLSADTDVKRYGLFETQTQVFYANCGTTAFCVPRYLRVTPEATGGGDGQSWQNAMTLAEAGVAATNAANVCCSIMLKTGTYYPTQRFYFTKGVSLCGGYAGTDDDAFTSTNSVSVLDGQDQLGEFVYFYHTASHRADFRRLEFRRAVNRAINKSAQYYSNGMMTFHDCRFVDNGRLTDAQYGGSGGCGILFSVMDVGQRACLVVSNCVFAGNVYTKETGRQKALSGRAVVLSNLGGGARFTDCQFVTNGVAWTQPLAGNAPNGASWGAGAMVSSHTPTTMERCVFRGNRYVVSENNTAVLAFENTQSTVPWKIALTNCLFVGNEGVASAKSCLTLKPSGIVVFKDSIRNTTGEVVNCTFAYNTVDTTDASAGICLDSGRMKVRNSIFYGNLMAPSGKYGSDIRLTTSSAVCDLDYSLFGSTSESNLYYATGATLTQGAHIYTGDPKFYSTFADFMGLLVVTNKTGETVKLRNFVADDATRNAAVALDVRVSSGSSSAIDGGDASPYDKEPSPNGGVVNLGAYGNTPEAHVTEVAQPAFAGAVTVTFPYGTTQPRVAFTTGGEGDYKATVTILWSTNGTDFVQYGEWPASRGQDFEHTLMTAFPSGGSLVIRAELSAFGAATVRRDVTFEELTNLMPASFGHGGGSAIVHVMQGATGKGDGTSWFDALSVEELPDAITGKGEVWIAGTNICEAAKKIFTPTGAIVVRGGFVGTEDSVAQRQTGTLSTIDGANAFVPLEVSNGAGVSVTFERIRFTRASTSGLIKTGAGDLTLRGCDFRANDLAMNGYCNGSGARIAGAAAAVVAITNCTFQGNLVGYGQWNYDVKGIGLCVVSARRAIVDDTLFLTNGVPLGAALNDGRWNGLGLWGAAANFTDTPVTMRRCTFRANRGCALSYGDHPHGGILALEGNCGGSAFTNCLFVGNDMPGRGAYNDILARTPNNGVVFLRLKDQVQTVDFANCTFALNYGEMWHSPIGVNVQTGAVHVVNSLFCGNRGCPDLQCGLDLNVATGATVQVEWSLFEGTNETYVTEGVPGSITWGEGIRTGDACLVTPTTALTSLLVTNTYTWASRYYVTVNVDRALAAGALPYFNAHLRGPAGYIDETTLLHCRTPRGKSPAIDAGDPAHPYANEPEITFVGTTGKRINAGAYGNTPWATMTSVPGAFLRVR